VPWVKLDDQLWAKPKVIAAGNEATGAYCRMLSYCGAQLTDGHVTEEIAGFIAPTPVLDALIERTFVAQSPDGGLLIPDYLDFNPSKKQVEKERAEARKRMKKVRAKSKRNKR
jgi:hypothetical protein